MGSSSVPVAPPFPEGEPRATSPSALPDAELAGLKTWHLLQRHRAGDSGAVDALFSRHYEKVLRVVRVRCGSSIPRDLELVDVVHDALVAAIEDTAIFH